MAGIAASASAVGHPGRLWRQRLLPMFPGALGSVLAGISWWVAIFGPIELTL